MDKEQKKRQELKLSRELLKHKEKNNKGAVVEELREPQKSLRVMPWVRQGLFAKINPPPTRDQVTKLAERLVTNWTRWQAECIEVIASTMQRQGYEYWPVSDEEVWVRQEDDTHVIDFVRIQVCRHGRVVFEIRVCVAICTAGKAAKFWARIGMPRLGTTIDLPSKAIAQLENNVTLYRDITQELCEWIFQKVEETSKELLLGLTIERWSWLEISSFGVNDKALAEYYTQFWDADTTLEEILCDPEADRKISSYFKKVTKIEGTLHDIVVGRNIQDVDWFTSPVMVRVKDGSVQKRDVLYLMQTLPRDNKVQAVGFGFDDSITGDVSHRSVVNVASYFQHKV